MGQEIVYCSKCQIRLRGSDFDSGKAYRIQAVIFCAACSQEAIRTVPEETVKDLLDAFSAGQSSQKSEPGPAPSGTASSPPTARSVVAPPKSSGAPVVIGVVMLAGIALVAILLSSSSPPAAYRPAPVVVPSPVVTPPPVRTAEELRREAPARAFAEIVALERGGRLSADELRRRYLEFAKSYPDAPESRSIEARLKVPEAPAGELKPAPGLVGPKPADPAPPEPPVPVKPPEPVAKPPSPPEPLPPKPPPEAPAPVRPSVPETAKLREAEAAFKKTANLEQAKTPQEKSQLARSLLSTATATAPGDADLFLRFRSARDLAAAASDLKLALQAIDAMAAAFDLDAMDEKVALLTKTQSRGMDPLAWATACLDLARQASAADDYEAAGKLAARAETFAVALKDGGLISDTREKVKEYTDFKREGDRVKPSLDALKAKPDDPAACAAVGRYLCLIKDDWDKGLPLIAKGTDGPFKKLAEQELAKPADASAQAALGDAWAAQSERELTIAKTRAKLRAVAWLDRALPGLSGSAKTAAEKKLSALGLALGPKAPPVLDLGGGFRLELIYCRPGVFTMGHAEPPADLAWMTDHRPPHQVELTRGFFLGKFEVTRGQFAAFVKATGYVTMAEREGTGCGRKADQSWGEIPGANWKKPVTYAQTDDDPVTLVSWADAKMFCDWLAARTRRGVRLPTEAEWEYACRAGTTTPWSFGSQENQFGEYGWNRDNSDWRTHPVGQKKPNAWGFHDMHGNAWEWCQDFLGPYKGDARDPEGLPNPTAHQARGGSWDVAPVHSLAAARWPLGGTTRSNTLGFRVAVR